MSAISTFPQGSADHARTGPPPGEGARHLEALYQLVDRLHRAESLCDIYGAALDAILMALRCDRASILLFDGEGVMRFVDSRGLSEGYRQVVEGHSPWTAAERNPRPICMHDVDTADLDESLRRVVKGEGISALCFVPLFVDGRLIGKFMTYYDAPHVFEDREIDLALIIGRQLAFGIARRKAEDGLRDSEERLRRDVLERRRTEAALRDNEHRLRLALEAGRMGTWEWSLASDRVTWSPGLESIHGLPPGAFGGTFEAYQADMHPEDRDRVLASIRRAVEEDVDHHQEYRIVWPDGSIHWIEARGKLFRDEDGVPARMIGVCTDVTERKRNEQRIIALGDDLRRRVEELNALLDVLPVGVLVAHDPECTHMTLNPAAAAMLEVPPGVNPSKSGPDAARLPFRIMRDGMEVPGAELPIQRAARTGEPVRGEVLEIMHQDGRASSEYICAVPLFDEAGRVRGALGAMVDMTERKRAEDALKAADRRKDEFLATLAHELRNPLAPIRNAIEILLMKSPPDPGLRWSQEVIDRQIRHMTRLLDDLLDVSRISYNKLELRRERVELAASVQSAIETSRPLIDAGRHRLTVTMPPEPLYLDADPVRLAQVFSNLLSNAAKYTEAGGHIHVRGERCGGEVRVSVSDDGVGIAAEMIGEIFGMFARGAGTLERSQGGLGVGLSLARGLVELHGGTIEACSAGLGKGSEFIVRLPVTGGERHRGETDPHAGRAQPRASGRRVLVVDDLKDSADSLATLLKVTGNEVDVAYDGESAIAQAERLRPEAILLDIGMPGLDGYEVCRRLRERPWSEGMAIVALTGWGQQDDRRRSREAGFDHHLVKPVEIAALMDLLARV